MYRYLVPLVGVLLLATCGPVDTYHQQGVSRSLLENDLLSCEVEALDKAPVATEIRRSAPTYIRGGGYCYGNGSCFYRPGYFASGEIYTVDVNAKLRKRLENQCMSSEGYAAVQIPRCEPGTLPPGNTVLDDRMPPMTNNTCVVKDTNGRWQIIEPAS